VAFPFSFREEALAAFDLASQLKDSSLLVEKALVAGQWVSARNGATFDVLDPATGQKIATVPDLGVEDVTQATAAAHRAQKPWAKFTARQRASSLPSKDWMPTRLKRRPSFVNIHGKAEGSLLIAGIGPSCLKHGRARRVSNI
jgi:hypothetical protein